VAQAATAAAPRRAVRLLRPGPDSRSIPEYPKAWNQADRWEFLLLLLLRWRERSMTGESATTTDHERIRRWVEARDGTPAAVRATESGDDPGVLRIRFRDESADDLDAIDWDQFFEKFEESELAFLYQDQTADGGTSRFHKFVKLN
jgi:hypothetical protein